MPSCLCCLLNWNSERIGLLGRPWALPCTCRASAVDQGEVVPSLVVINPPILGMDPLSTPANPLADRALGSAPTADPTGPTGLFVGFSVKPVCD